MLIELAELWNNTRCLNLVQLLQFSLLLIVLILCCFYLEDSNKLILASCEDELTSIDVHCEDISDLFLVHVILDN